MIKLRIAILFALLCPLLMAENLQEMFDAKYGKGVVKVEIK